MNNKTIKNLLFVGSSSKDEGTRKQAALVANLFSNDEEAWKLLPDYMPAYEFFRDEVRILYHVMNDYEKKIFKLLDKKVLNKRGAYLMLK
jgi:hypothetical protein